MGECFAKCVVQTCAPCVNGCCNFCDGALCCDHWRHKISDHHAHRRAFYWLTLVLLALITAVAAFGFTYSFLTLSLWHDVGFKDGPMIQVISSCGVIIVAAMLGWLAVLPSCHRPSIFQQEFAREHFELQTAARRLVTVCLIVVFVITVVLLNFNVAADNPPSVQAGLKKKVIVIECPTSAPPSCNDEVTSVFLNDLYLRWVSNTSFAHDTQATFDCCGFNSTYPLRVDACSASLPFCQPQIVKELDFRTDLIGGILLFLAIVITILLVGMYRLLYGFANLSPFYEHLGAEQPLLGGSLINP